MRFLKISLIFALATLGVVPFLSFGYSSVDVAETIYHAREIASGRVPHLDFFSHHFVGFILPFALIELFTNITPGLVWTMCAIWQAVYAILLWRLTSNYICAILAVTVGWFWGWEGMIFSLQVYLLPPLVIYLWALIEAKQRNSRQYLYAAAMILGVLFTCDQRILAFSLPIAITIGLCSQLQSFRIVLTVILIFAVAPLLYCLILYALNGWDYFVFQTILFPLLHRNDALDQSFLSRITVLLSTGLRQEWPAVTLALIGFLGLLIRRPSREFALLLVSYAIAGAIYVTIGGRPYLHYLLILSPVVLIPIALGTQQLAKTPRISALIQSGICIVAVLISTRPINLYLSTGSWQFTQDEDTYKKVGQFIEANSSSKQKILVWGYAPQVYLYANRLASFSDVSLMTIVGSNYKSSLATEQAIVPSMVETFKRTLEKDPPVFVAEYSTKPSACLAFPKGCPAKNFDFNNLEHLRYFHDFIQSKYQKVLSIDSELDFAVVYQHNPGK